MDFGVGDVLEVAKLAWDLYDQCYKVAKAAPGEFRQLVSELAGLKGVLKNIRDDVNSERSYVKRLDQDRKESLERLLKSIFSSLRKTQQLVVYFKSLGTDEEGLQVWKRTKWVHKRGEILQLRKQMTADGTLLGLCMSDINNASLARIEITIEEALNKQGLELEDDEVAPLMKSRTFSSTHRDSDFISTSTAIPKRPTERTLGEKTLVNDMDYPSSASGESDPGSPPLARIFRQTSTPIKSHLRHTSVPIGGNPPPSPFTDDGGSFINRRSSDHKGYLGENYPKGLLVDTKGKSNDYYLTTTPETPTIDHEQEFAAAIGTAKEELSRIRQKERQTRPLKKPDRGLYPEVASRVELAFEQSLKTEIEYRSLNTRDWLRIGTWWLLKATFRLEALEMSNAEMQRGGLSKTQISSSSYTQSYIDLLKATWILFECVLKSDYVIPMHSDENRKLFKDLEDSIRTEYKVFRSGVPDDGAFEHPDLNFEIWEHQQSSEETTEPILFEMDNSRWITVEPGDSGNEDERVVLRTFVDAAIGGRAARVHSRGASYMLILYTMEGQSEPLVSLVNQSGTLGLSRILTPEDLEDLSPPSSTVIDVSRTREMDAIQFNFGALETRIRFVYHADAEGFTSIPQEYFNIVKNREPRELSTATETLIFESSLEAAIELNTSTLKPLNKKSKAESCNLRILETTRKEGWQTTRRLVLSSSAAERYPWCREFFLPMDRVQLNRDLAREVNIKWSDCSREDFTKTDGSYNTIFSYIYDDTRPNHAYNFLFRFDAHADEFRKTILSLRPTATFDWKNDHDQSGAIYEIQDIDPKPKKYKGIVLTCKVLDWTYSQLFYSYRDTDYKYDENNLSVNFPQLSYTDYRSSHFKEPWKPNKSAQFSKCEKKVNQQTFEFPSPEVLREFMAAMSVEQNQLIFSARASYVSTDKGHIFGSSKSKSKGGAEVQLWKRGNQIRFASRWGDLVDEKWLSMTISSKAMRYSSDSNKINIDRTMYKIGRNINIVDFEAVKAKDESRATKQGPLTICFASTRDREVFTALVEGKPLQQGSRTRNIWDDLSALN